MITALVKPLLYSDRDARNWLAIRDCLVSPTTLGRLEVTFASEQQKLEFFLRFAQYAATRESVDRLL
jgi:hypothetical protein